MPLTVSDVSYDNASGSTMFRVTGAAYSVSRQIGADETLLTTTPVPSGELFVDHMAFTAGRNEYLISAPGETSRTLIFEHPATGEYSVDEVPDTFSTSWGWLTWTFLSYGRAFENVLRVDDASFKHATSRSHTAFQFINTTRPRPIFGANVDAAVSIDATISWIPGQHPEMYRPTPADEWLEAALEAETVLLRLPDGTRMFGFLNSGVDVSATHAYSASVSFSVTQSDYQEGPLKQAGVTWDSVPSDYTWNES